MTDWYNLRARLKKERGQLCEMCQRSLWTDCHHCLIHRRKGCEFLDCAENIQVLCHVCHLSNGHGWEDKVNFWAIQCARYGESHMREWMESLPLKVKPRF